MPKISEREMLDFIKRNPNFISENIDELAGAGVKIPRREPVKLDFTRKFRAAIDDTEKGRYGKMPDAARASIRREVLEVVKNWVDTGKAPAYTRRGYTPRKGK